jgi:hypothetical protein
MGQALRGSAWAFSVIEAVHLLALALLGGMVLLVDFRLFGLGLKRQPVFELAREVEPYLVGGLIAMLASGFLLFMSEAMKCYQSLPFRIKIVFLFPAIVYTFTIRRRVTLEDVPAASARNKIVALVSIFLWSMVGIMGRAVAFY